MASADTKEPLLTDDYFLHVPHADADIIATYSIVSNFRSWQFPYDALPDPWHEASAKDKRLAAERGCSIEAVATVLRAAA